MLVGTWNTTANCWIFPSRHHRPFFYFQFLWSIFYWSSFTDMVPQITISAVSVLHICILMVYCVTSEASAADKVSVVAIEPTLGKWISFRDFYALTVGFSLELIDQLNQSICLQVATVETRISRDSIELLGFHSKTRAGRNPPFKWAITPAARLSTVIPTSQIRAIVVRKSWMHTQSCHATFD